MVLCDNTGQLERLDEAISYGWVANSEALARLQIPFSLHGYQDVRIPFKDTGHPLAVARPALDDLMLAAPARRAVPREGRRAR